MKLVIMGSPGAGKGTQTKFLSKYYDIAHISTGDILRLEMRNGTDIGKEIAHLMDSGSLVPDDIVTALLKQRIKHDDCKNGFILDGFPRNRAQAETLDDVVGKIDKAVYVEVTDDVIIERMSGRVVCPSCGAIYNKLSNPTKVEGICDVCAAELIQREDDKATAVKKRLALYHELTKPLISFFEEKGILLTVDGTRDIGEITEQLVKALGEKV